MLYARNSQQTNSRVILYSQYRLLRNFTIERIAAACTSARANADLYMCDGTYLYVCYDSWICVTLLIYVCDVNDLYAWRDVCQSRVCVMWRMAAACASVRAHADLYTCGVIHLHVWRDEFTCVTWLIYMYNVTNANAWRESCICATSLIHDCTHIYVYVYVHIYMYIYVYICK